MDRNKKFQQNCTKAYYKTCGTVYEPIEYEYHICYMKKKEKKMKKNDKGPEVLTCYYDIETYQQDKGLDNNARKIFGLIPYLQVCQMICEVYK